MGYNKLTSLSANIKAIETAVAIRIQGRTATQEEKRYWRSIQVSVVSRMYWIWVRTNRLTKVCPSC